MNTQQTADRLAVVLLHGIGEQRPMATLRGFVRGAFDEPGRSKPDRLSELFEVRRLDVRSGGFNVDCYELYWAHHMRSSTLTHIAKWLTRLFSTPAAELKRMSSRLDESLYIKTRAVVSGFLLLLAAAVVVSSYVLHTWEWFNAGTGALLASALAALMGLVVWLANYQMVEVVGDAARYLDSSPANVGVRQAIRAECVRFLKELNDSDDPCYSRIVLVGHSLGSVIAYDALRLLWAELKPHATVPAVAAGAGGLLAWLHGGVRPVGEVASSPQRALFEQLLPAGRRRWRISDLVTVGSPLTHAPLLLAESVESFEHLKKPRELPTCPPQRDDDADYCGWAETPGSKLHHAAPFAVVQWTNLFFPSDPIGGRLCPIFGSGIHDVELPDAPKNAWSDHVRYWAAGSGAGSSSFRLEVRRLLEKATS